MRLWRNTNGRKTLCGILAVAAVSILGAMLFVFHSSNKAIDSICPLADATMEIGIASNQAHFWLTESFVKKDLSVSDSARYLLQKADLYAEAILNGGTVYGIAYSRLDDSRIRIQVEAMRAILGRLMSESFDHEFVTLADSPQDPNIQHQDSLFADLLSQTVAVESRLRQIIRTKVSYLRQVQIFVIGVCVGFFVLVGVVVYRYFSERNRTERDLKYRCELERIITSLSSRFITLAPEDTDANVTYALKIIGEFTGADRAYVIQLDDLGETMDNTHEWCAEGIEPRIDRLKGLRIAEFSYICARISNGHVFHCPRVADLPEEARVEKYEFELGGIQSLICVPMISRGAVVGHLGFESVRRERRWSDDTVVLLRIVGELLSTALERERVERELRNSEEKFRVISEQALMGIAILQDNTVKYSNSAARELFETDPDQAPSMLVEKIKPLLHPEDPAWMIQQRWKTQTGDDSADQHYEFRLNCPSGRTKWVEVYLRTLPFEGHPADFVTLIDITRRKRGEAVQTALLRISEATNLTTSLDDLFRTIHKTLGTLIDTTNFCVALYDPENNGYTLPYCANEFGGTEGSSRRLTEGLTDYVRRTGKPLLANKKVHRELHRRGEVVMIDPPPQVWLGAPLKTSEGVLGVVAVQSYTDPNLYDEDDLDLLSFVSGYISMAVHRRLSEQAVRNSEQRLRSIFEASHSVSCMLTDVAGGESRILELNAGAERMFGYSRDEIVGKPLAILHQAENVPKFAEWQTAMRQGKDGFSDELVLIRKSGERFPALHVISPLFDSKDVMHNLLCVTIDITDRKQAEQALQESEERFRAIYEQAAVGVGLLDLDGRWLRVNQKLCDTLGYDTRELRCMTYRDITHPDDQSTSPPLIEGLLRNEIPTYSVEKRYVRKDGSGIWVKETGTTARDTNGAPMYIISIIEDITERKNADDMVTRYTDQLLKANQKLEAKQAELEEFIYTVSHDLRSPVVSISGFTGLIRERLADGMDSKTSSYLERVRANTDVMENLIGELLELSRIGCIDEEQTTIDFEQLVTEVFESLSVSAMAKNVRLVRASPLPKVRGWCKRVRQLLTNLVDNAIKYMPDQHNQAVVEIGWTHSNPGADGHEQGVFFVRDNGAGIPQQFHQRIFGMFQRADCSKHRADGSGVGLSIVKRIVEKQGGTIWLDSQVGSGATFYFTLPLETPCGLQTHETADIQRQRNLPDT